MDQVIINSVKKVKDESKMEVAKFLLQLQETHVDKATRKTEELGGSEQQSPTQVQKDPE